MQLGKNIMSFIFAFLVIVSGIQANGGAVIENPLSTKTISIGVMLNWSTSVESNADVFAIEKSQNGVHFTQIARVKSQGSEEKGFEYTFIDLNPENGISHYRLKVIHKDGTFAYLESTTAKLTPKINFVISNFSTDNPNESWNVNLNVYNEGSIVYEWTSLDNTVYEQGIKRMKEGMNDLTFPMQDWPDGIYRLDLEMSGDKKSLTIQKFGETTIQIGKE